jgi:hypothetical protein
MQRPQGRTTANSSADPMKQPKRRIAKERSSDNDKRQLRSPALTEGAREELAARARFEGSGKHKLEPRAFKLEPGRPDADDSFCDGHAGFSPDDMARIPNLVVRGIRAGLIGHRDSRGDPTVLWTVDDNGWVYEARLTTATKAVYHGYPLLEGDAFARKVISRYAEYVDAHPEVRLERSLENALDRYL